MKRTGRINIDVRRGGYTLEELDRMRRKLAKRANARLLSLERAGRDYWAYDIAQQYLSTRNRRRFSERGFKGSPRNAVRELEEIISFLNSESSTITGSKAIETKIKSSFARKGVNVSDLNSRDFFDFLDWYNSDKRGRSKIQSAIAIDFYNKAIQQGKSKEDVQAAIEQFKQGRASLRDMYSANGIRYNASDINKISRRKRKN